MIAQAHLDLVLLAVLGARLGAAHRRLPLAGPVSDPARDRRRGAGLPPRHPRRRSSTPMLVLILVLPPLLYAAAFFSSLRELRDNLREISLLAIGLVIFTMARRGRRRPRGHRRHVVGGGLRAGRRRVADRSRRGDGDRLARRRAAALRDDRRGRGAGQRRDGSRRLQVRGRRHGQRQLLVGRGGRALRPQRDRRHRDRHRRRLRHRPAAQEARRRADGDHDLAGHAVLRLPAGRGARRLRGAGRGDGRHLPRLALAASSSRRPPGSRPSRCGRSSSSSSTPCSSCSSGCSCRASSTGSAGMSTSSILVDAAVVSRGGHRHPLPVGLPDHLRAALAVAPRARARARRRLAVPGDRGVDGHARRGVAGRGAGHPADDRRRRRLPAARPHHLPHLRGHPRHAASCRA